MISIHTCARCGHKWASRKESKPNRCAGCCSTYWWRPARVPAPKEKDGVKRPVGRPTKYPQVVSLSVGESVLLPWIADDKGMPDTTANARHSKAINHLNRVSGRTYRTEPQSAGLRVTRLS